jgi:2,5-furandicarboxylate decarboxylase 1
MLLARDPESGHICLGVFRMRVRTPPHFISTQIVSRGMSRAVAGAEAQNEALPVVVVLGIDPASFLGSVLQVEPEIEKLELTGALRGEPLQIGKGITVDLPVPAQAEMVLEGRVLPGRRIPEGPQGDSPGLYTTSQNHLIEVTAATHREQFLYHALLPWGREEDALRAVAYEIPMEMRLRARDSAVQAVHLIPGTCSTHAVLSLKKQNASHPRDLMGLCFQCFPGLKQVVVVDDDVDPANQRMVSWAFSTRFQGERDVVTFSDTTGQDRLSASKIGLDATMPLEERDRFVLVGMGEKANKQAQDILRSWQSSGMGESERDIRRG